MSCVAFGCVIGYKPISWYVRFSGVLFLVLRKPGVSSLRYLATLPHIIVANPIYTKFFTNPLPSHFEAANAAGERANEFRIGQQSDRLESGRVVSAGRAGQHEELCLCRVGDAERRIGADQRRADVQRAGARIRHPLFVESDHVDYYFDQFLGVEVLNFKRVALKR